MIASGTFRIRETTLKASSSGFSVRLTGSVLEGHSKAESLKKFSRRFKVTETKAKAILASAPRELRKCSSQEEAIKYVNALCSDPQ
jgi:hypothetical protein